MQSTASNPNLRLQRPPSEAVPQPSSGTKGVVGLTACLIAFATVTYGPYLAWPFIGDDYIFLEHTTHSSFLKLWSFAHSDFGWYRPLSREMHFWGLQHLFGMSEVAFRTAGIALWICALTLYYLIAERIAGARIAAAAVVPVSALALWGTPIIWISGSQDLWMLCFGLGAVLAYVSGRRVLALPLYAGALLSKETAVVFPLILFSYERLFAGTAWRRTIERVAVFALVTIVWILAHPVLLPRLIAATNGTAPVLEHRLGAPLTAVRTLLATVSLDLLPRPQDLSWRLIASALAGAVVLGGLLWWLLRAPEGHDAPRRDTDRLKGLGLSWAVAGWIPMFLPSIGWQAYYGCVGTLGAWLYLAPTLTRRPRIAVSLVAALVLVRAAYSATPSLEWGHEWLQRRAGSFIKAIRSEMLRVQPTLPPHARVYLGRLPNNIGLVHGSSPALRVWYGDSTLTAGFYSWYRPRRPEEPQGQDFFFRFDTVGVLVPVRLGAESTPDALAANPAWKDDHEKLAMLFLRARDFERAGDEFAKLSLLPESPESAIYAGVAYEVAGAGARADSLYQACATRLGIPLAQVRGAARSLRNSLPALLARPQENG